MMDGARVPAKHVVVGTAGHIDHGKTSLVKALTGTDTDRLPEEKARGITIDLGFAFLEEPDGLTIEIVDVPGHERFVKNMLAGVGGIDLALLVIAADEGVMPQTREHLAICQLLRIKAGMVALTKTDLVEPDWIELVKDDVTRLLADTLFAGCPIVPVSVKTGQGLSELRQTLAEPAAFRPRSADSRCMAGPSRRRRRDNAPPSTSRAWSARPSSGVTSWRRPGRSSPRSSPMPRSSSSPTRRGRSRRAIACAFTSAHRR